MITVEASSKSEYQCLANMDLLPGDSYITEERTTIIIVGSDNLAMLLSVAADSKVTRIAKSHVYGNTMVKKCDLYIQVRG